jgi:hypothetical protein
MMEDKQRRVEINNLEKVNSKLELEIIQLEQDKDTLRS